MIHSTAIIEQGVELGSGVSVGAFSYVQKGAKIGQGCVLGPQVVIYGSVRMGERNAVHAGAVLGDTPQDLAFKGGESFVRIGNDCTFREGVTVHRGTEEGSSTWVGDGCYLMGFSHLAHNVKLGHRVIVVNSALLAGYVTVEDHAFISGNCSVHQFVRIGALAMLGGNGGISSDVPPFCMTSPAEHNQIAGLNLVGLKRAGSTPSERRDLKKAFRLVFRAGLNVSEALHQIRSETLSEKAVAFCAFIEDSERGICRYQSKRRGP